MDRRTVGELNRILHRPLAKRLLPDQLRPFEIPQSPCQNLRGRGTTLVNQNNDGDRKQAALVIGLEFLPTLTRLWRAKLFVDDNASIGELRSDVNAGLKVATGIGTDV